MDETVENRRSVYRLGVSSSPCTVTAHFGDRVAVGMALDVSAEGVGATFQTDGVNDLPHVGEVGVVTIVADWCVDPIRIEARAVRRADGDGVCVFGFGFTGLPTDIEPDLHGIFNRRNAVRLRPKVCEEIDVMISSNDVDIRAVLRDISTSGIGVVASLDSEQHIGTTNVLDIVLTPTGDSDPIRVPSIIRNRRFSEDGNVLYGIAFAIPPADARTQKLVDEYVAQFERSAVQARVG